MPEPVAIDFQVGGIRDVLRAFDTVETRAERAERQQSRTAQSGSRERVSSTQREVDEKERAYAKLAKETERWERQQVREAERAAKERALASEKAQKDETRSAEKEALARKRIRESEQRAEDREFANSMRERARMRERETAEIARQSAQRRREVEQEAAAGERAALRVRRHYGSSIGGAAVSSIGRTVGAIGTMAGAAAGIGGGFMISGALRGEMAFGEAVAQASNMSYIPGTTTRAQASPDRIAALARGVQNLTNIDKTSAANAIKRYVGLSSDLEGVAGVTKSGRTGIEELAVMSRASGTDFMQLAEAAASIKAGNPEMKTGALMTTMRSLIGAGKLGTLPLDVLASHIGEIQATAGRLAGGNTTEGLMANQAKLLGLAQLTGRATGGDAAEAATAIRHLTGDIARHGLANGMTKEMIYAGGDPAKGMLGPSELLANVFQVSKGRFDVEQKILGERAIKVADALNPVYQAAGGGAAGVAAVRAEVQKFERVGYSEKDTNQEFATVMATSSERLASAMKHFDEVIAGAATPAFEHFVETLVAHQGDIDRIITGLGKLAEWLVENPFKGIGAIIAANVMKDVLAAGIGVAAKTAIERMIAGSVGGSVPGAGSIPGAGGAVGAGAGVAGLVGGVALTAASALAVGSAIGMGVNALEDSSNQKRVANMTPEQLKADLGKRYKNITGLKEILADEDSSESTMARATGALHTQEKAQQADLAQLKAMGIDFDPLKDAIKELTKTLQTHGKQVVGGSGDTLSPATTAAIRRMPLGQRPVHGGGNSQ